MLVLCSVAAACAAPGPLRQTVSLDGEWDVAEGAMDAVPATFAHKCPVPGLADMAQPPFEGVGPKEADGRRAAFWYRRTFTLTGPVPAVATLKVHKAMFTTRVYLNGQLVGDHAPSFTPGLFDVLPHLKGDGRPNELIIRVGASRKAVPPGCPDGWDFEKVRYIPGVYDSVELILSGSPHVVRVQTVPDLASRSVRVVALIANAGPVAKATVTLKVREAATGTVVGEAGSQPINLGPGQERTVNLKVPLKPCRLWSPEDPFLYELETATGADTLRTRFGMREFRFDAATGRAILNGKPYFLRGTNVCIYRFFEDSSRGDRPWREEWVRRLHRTFKDMHWNSIRYCIGFPPEAWYRIADEEGFLIQDEFPIWYMDNWPAGLKSDQLVREYTEWMQERWNHPCVVIWDAQNETHTAETGKAIQAVRGLDLSDRPWDNGWSPPQAPTDVFEAHPYLMYDAPHKQATFRLLDLARTSPRPEGNPGNNPIIINEYAWLWLNRDGSPTTLSKRNYDRLLEPGATVDQRFALFARLLAAKTEFWRCHRQVAGILHFCGLGYSRPDGQTSDHFIDLEKLTLEPNFKRYVGDAFAPVGLMIDEWAENLPAGKPREIRVIVVNDLQTNWQGRVRLRVVGDGKDLWESSVPCKVPALGTEKVKLRANFPDKTGRYQLVAELLTPGREPVCSLRDVAVLSDADRRDREGLAFGRKVWASSAATIDGESYPPEFAVDGNPATYWSSEFADPAWLRVDLGESVRIRRVTIDWETAYAKAFAVQVSADGRAWTDVFKTDSGAGGTSEIDFAPVAARYVRVYGTARGTEWGYAIRELSVYKE
jgi:hypothetical protein